MSRSNQRLFSRRILTSLVLIGAVCMTRTASAQVYAVTDLSDYESATNSDVDSITFNGLPLTQSSATSYNSGLTVGGVSLTSNSGTTVMVVGPQFASGMYDFDTTSTLNAQQELLTGTSIIDASFPSTADLPPNGVSAVGAELGSGFAAGTITAIITLADGSTSTYMYAAQDASTDGLGFLGFISAGADISSISLSDSTSSDFGGPDIVIDNLTYGDDASGSNIPGGTPLPGGPPVTVPEPSSLALLATGATALILFRRRLAAFVL